MTRPRTAASRKRTHELPTFLGSPVPVDLVARLDAVAVERSAVTFTCGTDRYVPALQDYYGTLVEAVHAPPTPGDPFVVRVDAHTPHILRVRACPAPAGAAGDGAEGVPAGMPAGVPDHDTEMVVGRFDEAPALSVDEADDAVTVDTGAVRLVARREPFRLELHDGDGRVLWATKTADLAAFRRSEEEWNPAEQRWIFHARYAYPLGVTRGDDAPSAFWSFDLAHDEHVLGFGESFGPFDKRGTSQRLWLQEAFSNASPASYKQVPFYMSSRGVGVYVNTSNPVRCDVGSLDHTAVGVVVEDAELLDVWLIHGPEPAAILPRYTAVSGAPAVPPLWSFGLWMSRITYRTQEEVEEVARALRDSRIPCDVIHVDTGWFAREYVCDWRFGPQFPDPAGMTARLAEQGFRVSLWQWPNVTVDSPAFAEGLARGAYARRASGHAYLQPGGYGQDAAVVDWSNPAAVEWMQGLYADLFDKGIAAIKVDYGEGAPPDAVYAGVPGEAMHNRYPLLYQRAVWDATVRAHGEGNAVLWARSAWAGSQRYPVHWSGDGVARFEDLACVLRSALSFGVSGFPFYSHDIGGFTGLPDARLYVRWAQMGLLMSHARTHGQPPREPWRYGEEAERIVRDWLELRYRLLPYLWSQAVDSGGDEPADGARDGPGGARRAHRVERRRPVPARRRPARRADPRRRRHPPRVAAAGPVGRLVDEGRRRRRRPGPVGRGARVAGDRAAVGARRRGRGAGPGDAAHRRAAPRPADRPGVGA